jgi:ketosteroid isomerase-like protein
MLAVKGRVVDAGRARRCQGLEGLLTRGSSARRFEGLLAGYPRRGAALLVSKEDIVVRLFEAFSRRELMDALELLHPDIVFQPMTAQVTRAGEPYRGHDGIRRYVADMEAQWEELTLQPSQIRAAGDAVVALGLVSGRGRGGAFRDAPTTWMFKLKDGLVIDAQIFSEARNVFEALLGEEVVQSSSR